MPKPGPASPQDRVPTLRPGLLYFAYGCNMDPAFLAGVVGTPIDRGWPARADGWRLAFNLADEAAGFGIVANLVESRDCCVYGVVYRLPHEALHALDAFEDVPEHYRRATIWVEPSGRRARQAAVVYLGQPGYAVPEGRPDPPYLELLLRGGQVHRLPGGYIDWIRAVAEGKAHDCYRPERG